MREDASEEAEVERSIRMWRPQAEVIARKSGSPDAVAMFLKARGIPHQEACSAAILLW